MTVLSVATIGIAFSLITIDAGTVWSSGIVHAIWNFVLCSVLSISMKMNESAIITYVLDTKTIVLTGGDFGIESSVISLIEFVIVLIIALYLIKSDGVWIRVRLKKGVAKLKITNEYNDGMEL